jgi:hypothetical protein
VIELTTIDGTRVGWVDSETEVVLCEPPTLAVRVLIEEVVGGVTIVGRHLERVTGWGAPELRRLVGCVSASEKA